MGYTIQGNPVNIGTEPFLHNDKHYVPLREVVEALGGTATFDNDTKVATATIGPWVATITMADRNIDVSGTPVALTADPYVEDGVMYVPFDLFRDAFGYDVTLNDGDMTIVNPNA